MEEKIVMRTEFAGSKLGAIICFSLVALLLILCFSIATAVTGDPMWAFEGIEYGYYGFFIGVAIFSTLGIISIITKSGEIIVTKDKVTVYGPLPFNSQTTLPIKDISFIKRGLFQTIVIATSSGHISCHSVVKVEQLYDCIEDLMLTA